MKNRILYVAPQLSSFIRSDIGLLSKEYDVIVNTYNWKDKKLVPWLLLQQLIFLLRHIRSFEAIIISFGGYWAVLPGLLGKWAGIPVFIILNGTDCASLPSVHYGSLRKPLLRKACHTAYKSASALLPVSESLVKTVNTYPCLEGSTECRQGFKHFFPELTTPYKVIYNGFDPEFWQPSSEQLKVEKTFLAVFSPGQFILKGGDLILDLAMEFTDCTFYIAGTDRAPEGFAEKENVIFLGKIKPEELRKYYQRSRFYLQLSMFEGFGCALCEAMLCGCIPIGSNANMIPEIIGSTGIIVSKRDKEVLKGAIKNALGLLSPDTIGKAARERVITNYHQDIRQKALLDILQGNL